MARLRRIEVAKVDFSPSNVAVVGLGYVGLPFAVNAARAGFMVTGIDVNAAVAEGVASGRNHIEDVDDAELASLVADGRLTATTDMTVVKDMDVVVIAVPTPLRDGGPDLAYVESACKAMAPHIAKGTLVSLESTTYPGTTEEVMRPILESGSGLKAEKDFFLAYSPERIDPGNPQFDTHNTNKLVGGVGPRSTDAAVAFYSKVIANIVPVSSPAVAEFAKIYENTYRAVNIALVNEMAMLCDGMGLDVWEVLDAAFTKPFGIQAFYPGPGVGGHCIPIDPHYLEWKAEQLGIDHTRFIRLAGETNRAMPAFVVDKLGRALAERGHPGPGKVLVLGAAYKRDISDCRESPSVDVIRGLIDAGHDVSYHDPFVRTLTLVGIDLESVPLDAKALAAADAVIIATDHTRVDYADVIAKAGLVFDTRNATKGLPDPDGKVVRL